MANATRKHGSAFSPLGTSGLPRYAGYVFDEWLPELQGSRGRRVLREMADNSPIIGSMLFAIEMLIRQVSWTVAPATDDEAGHSAAKFVFEALHDMETPWEDTLADVMSMLVYGWSLFEQVYKRRDGKASKYDDGRIGWQGWQMRGQETLLRWDYEDYFANYPRAFVQLGPPDFREHTIPMDRCLLFRTTTRRANPEGRPVIRNAYSSWYYVKNLEAIEAIGAERDMAGLPVGLVPSSILDPNGSAEEKALASSWQDLVKNIRRDEQEGVLVPSDRDDNGNLEFELKLLSTGGTRQFNLGGVIERHEQRILMTCLCDFIMLGHTNVGTQSLGKTKIELFTSAITAYLAMIGSQVNDVAIPRLMKMNGIDIKHAPTIQHGQVERMDLDMLGNFIYQLGQAGFIFDTNPQGALMNHLMEQAHLPAPPEGLQNPFPDQWQEMMPNPANMWPSPGNNAPAPLGPLPAQLPSGPPGPSAQMPASNPPGAGGQQQQPAGAPTLSKRARPSLRQPNMPKAPKAEPPHIKRGPLQSDGALATAQRRKRAMSEVDMGQLQVAAFDLDNTALRFPQLLVPFANALADQGTEIGVLTGNWTATAAEMWQSLGYPSPSFFLVHPEMEQGATAQWKADQCKRLGVNLIVDDFSGGRHVALFAAQCEQIGCDTLALEVVLPPNTPYQQVAKPLEFA